MRGLAPGGLIGVPGRDDLSILLDCNANSVIGISEEISGLFSARAEGLIQAAILVITRNGEISGREGVAMLSKPYRDDLAVRLNRYGIGLIAISEKVSCL